jgi:serine/threonine protein kinase
MRTDGMVEHYGTCSIWIIDTATTSLSGWHMRIHLDELLCAEHLRRFQRKRMELAWMLLHIMDEVHKNHNLHNDISPDNILLHFPEEESKVYIGVCDWALYLRKKILIIDFLSSLCCRASPAHSRMVSHA